jgi:crossover junction endodeoxyribonuclease RuvC
MPMAKQTFHALRITRNFVRMNTSIRIIGIDPGLRHMGWGIVEVSGSRLSYIASGTIHSDDKSGLAVRLRALHEGLSRVVAEYDPQEAAVEETFVNRDPRSALKLGQARGIAIVVPALAGLLVAEYAANLIKMVKMLLPRCNPGSADAADALAVAITHAQHRGQTAAALMRAAQ